jgi:predicted ATPase
LSEFRSKIDQLVGKRDEIKDRLAENLAEKNHLISEKSKIVLCQKLGAFLSENNQSKIINLFETSVSAGLKDLFDDSYDFRFNQGTRGDSSACEFEIQTSEFPGWSSPKMSHGESVAEIIGIILRIVLVKLDRRSRPIVILDEPSSGVETERQPLLSKFIKDLCEKFGIQVICVTHSEGLCEMATVIDLEKKRC